MSEVVVISNRDELVSLLNDNAKVVLKFTAPAWCVPCQRLAPHYKAAAEQSQDVVFASIDVDEHNGLAVEYAVQGVPTVLLYEDGLYVKDLKERTAIKLINELKG